MFKLAIGLLCTACLLGSRVPSDVIAAPQTGTPAAASGEAVSHREDAPQDESSTGEATPESEPAPPPKEAPEDETPVEAIDVETSLDDATGKVGWSLEGDLRGGYSDVDEDARDGSSQEIRELIGRFRIEGVWSFTPRLRARARLAGTCSDEDCNLEFVMNSSIEGSSLARGEVTLDELFLHRFRSESFDVALGRLQTRFVSRAGVFTKSLDRNDSNNVNVNWTDGLHGTLRHRSGWEGHVILQHNSADGTGNVRRAPLDFRDDDARITYFVAAENVRPRGPSVQRGIDVSYLPQSLLADGTADGRVEDYWGWVARFAARWPPRMDRMRLRVAGELGYAPATPTKSALDIAGAGDVDGLAWNVAASLMDFRRGHDVGLNYGRTGAGWLLSPQYTNNEELVEVRYRWRVRDKLSMTVRARRRVELEPLIFAQRERERFDVYARATWRFSVKQM